MIVVEELEEGVENPVLEEGAGGGGGGLEHGDEDPAPAHLPQLLSRRGGQEFNVTNFTLGFDL